jgi:thioester reductase-like protein
VIAIAGSLEETQMGLSAERWQSLTESVDTVFHIAAFVNMLMPYESMRKSNVDGTLEVVRFLCHGRNKYLHYASTLSVFVATTNNKGTALESDNLSDPCQVFGGYAQTKYASELLLRSLEEKAGPVTYHRLGLITGDSRTAATSSTDFLALFVRGLTALGCAPEQTGSMKVDITPIDFAAAAMVELSLRTMKTGRSCTYHIANERSLTLDELISVLQKQGVPIKRESGTEFLRRASELKSKSVDQDAAAACLALCRCLPGESSFNSFRTMDLFQATDIVFDMHNTKAVLSATNLSCPPPNEILIDRYVAVALKAQAPSAQTEFAPPAERFATPAPLNIISGA